MNMAWLIVFFRWNFPAGQVCARIEPSFGATAFLTHVLYDPGIAMLEQVL